MIKITPYYQKILSIIPPKPLIDVKKKALLKKTSGVFFALASSSLAAYGVYNYLKGPSLTKNATVFKPDGGNTFERDSQGYQNPYGDPEHPASLGIFNSYKVLFGVMVLVAAGIGIKTIINCLEVDKKNEDFVRQKQLIIPSFNEGGSQSPLKGQREETQSQGSDSIDITAAVAKESSKKQEKIVIADPSQSLTSNSTSTQGRGLLKKPSKQPLQEIQEIIGPDGNVVQRIVLKQAKQYKFKNEGAAKAETLNDFFIAVSESKNEQDRLHLSGFFRSVFTLSRVCVYGHFYGAEGTDVEEKSLGKDLCALLLNLLENPSSIFNEFAGWNPQYMNGVKPSHRKDLKKAQIKIAQIIKIYKEFLVYKNIFESEDNRRSFIAIGGNADERGRKAACIEIFEKLTKEESRRILHEFLCILSFYISQSPEACRDDILTYFAPSFEIKEEDKSNFIKALLTAISIKDDLKEKTEQVAIESIEEGSSSLELTLNI